MSYYLSFITLHQHLSYCLRQGGPQKISASLISELIKYIVTFIEINHHHLIILMWAEQKMSDKEIFFLIIWKSVRFSRGIYHHICLSPIIICINSSFNLRKLGWKLLILGVFLVKYKSWATYQEIFCFCLFLSR